MKLYSKLRSSLLFYLSYDENSLILAQPHSSNFTSSKVSIF